MIDVCISFKISANVVHEVSAPIKRQFDSSFFSTTTNTHRAADNGTYMLGMFSLPLLQLQLLPLPSTGCISASATGRLIIRIQMLEIEYSTILGLAIGTIELGGGVCCIVTALRQRRWRRSRRRCGGSHLAQRQRWRFV